MSLRDKIYCYYCTAEFNADHACEMRFVKQYLRDIKESAISYCIARCTGSEEDERAAYNRLSMVSNAEGLVKEL